MDRLPESRCFLIFWVSRPEVVKQVIFSEFAIRIKFRYIQIQIGTSSKNSWFKKKTGAPVMLKSQGSFCTDLLYRALHIFQRWR